MIRPAFFSMAISSSVALAVAERLAGEAILGVLLLGLDERLAPSEEERLERGQVINSYKRM
jgi:hypothetical protein